MEDYYVPLEKIKRERHITLVIFIPLFIVLIILLSLVIVKDNSICSTQECKKSTDFLATFIDEKYNPCENFYNYACGRFIRNAKEENLSYTVDLERQKVSKILKDFVTAEIGNDDSRSVKLQKRFYKSCMNLSAIEDDYNSVIINIFDELGGWPLLIGPRWNGTNFDIFELMVNARKNGLYFDWFLVVGTDRDYMDEHKRETLKLDLPQVNKVDSEYKARYLDLLVNVAEILGVTIEQAAADFKKIIKFESELSEIVETSQVDRQHKTTYRIDNIKTPWPKIYWLMFLNNVTQKDLPSNEPVVFSVGSYLPKLGTLISKTDTRTQANYFFWKIFESYTPFLTKNIRSIIQEYRRHLYNQTDFDENREEFCVDQATSSFQYVSEANFARKYANQERRDEVKKMLENICCVLNKNIRLNKWMDEETKEKALIKLGKVKYRVGAPEEVYHEEEFDRICGLNEIYFSSNNVVDMNRELFSRRMDHTFDLNKPKTTLTKMKFYESIPNINANFYMDTNTLLVPAGIMQGSYYSKNRPNYLNYGTLGVILAHEMSHGIGIEGSTYVEGNKTTNWWSNQTKKNFFRTVQCLLRNCTSGINDKSIKMNCTKSLDENFADYAGLKLSYEAYEEWVMKNGEEYSLPEIKYNNPEQIFFTTYATAMCHSNNQVRNEGDNHMLPYQRILGSYRNSEYFSRNFGCTSGSYMNPREKCEIL